MLFVLLPKPLVVLPGPLSPGSAVSEFNNF
ncbi:MAG: hypothetical protein ACI959_001520 [Limisphaerales bacterium]